MKLNPTQCQSTPTLESNNMSTSDKWSARPLMPSSKHSICLSSSSRKPRHPHSGYPPRPRRTKISVWRKPTSISQNTRSGTSTNPETCIGSRRNIHNIHEEQYHYPIQRHPLHYHPIYDFHIWGNISNPTDWPQTEEKSMQYDPQTPIDTVFDQVKDLLEYR